MSVKFRAVWSQNSTPQGITLTYFTSIGFTELFHPNKFLLVVSSGPFETSRFRDPLRASRKTGPFFWGASINPFTGRIAALCCAHNPHVLGVRSGCCAPHALHFIPVNEFLDAPERHIRLKISNFRPPTRIQPHSFRLDAVGLDDFSPAGIVFAHDSA